MKQGKARYVYPGGNTKRGFHSFYRQGLAGMERIFILKGGPGTGKSTLIRRIGAAMLERGYDVEYWICSSDNDSLDGVLIPAIGVAMIDGTAPHVVDPQYPGALESIINLGDHWDEELLARYKQEIVACCTYISEHFNLAYEKLAEAGALREEIAARQAARRDEEKLARLASRLSTDIFHPQRDQARHLFSSALTPKGLIRQAHALSKGYPYRYVLQGAPGSGQAEIFATLISSAQDSGKEMEIYHCAYDAQEVELLLFPEIGVAVLNADALEEGEISPTDQVVDLQSLLMAEGKEEAPQAKELAAQFDNLVGLAAGFIAQAKEMHDDLESYYIRSMDFEAVDFVASRVFNKILGIAAKKQD